MSDRASLSSFSILIAYSDVEIRDGFCLDEVVSGGISKVGFTSDEEVCGEISGFTSDELFRGRTNNSGFSSDEGVSGIDEANSGLVSVEVLFGAIYIDICSEEMVGSESIFGFSSERVVRSSDNICSCKQGCHIQDFIINGEGGRSRTK